MAMYVWDKTIAPVASGAETFLDYEMIIITMTGSISSFQK